MKQQTTNRIPEWLSPFERRFVGAGFKVADADSVKKWFQLLLERKTETAAELEKWLEDYSELLSIIGEEGSSRYIAMTCDTRDSAKREAYLFFVREIQPAVTELSNRLDRKFYDSPAGKELPADGYGRVTRIISTSIELFAEENIPLEVKLSEMSHKYQGITGGWMVEFKGKKQTMPQMGRYLLKPERELRESAWRKTAERRLEDVGALDALFDEMLETRKTCAQNLGLKDYREYCFKSKLRDYTPDDCLEFHDAIESAAVPLMKKVFQKRRELMKLDALKPWDTQADPLGREPLEPFGNVSELQDGVEEIFRRIDARLGERFASIREFMDLDSREGKAPGGYQATYEEKRMPFIFANSAGVHSDVITLLHEGGHAFHTLQSRNRSLMWYRHATMEFAEVASMTQELFANPHLELFYHDSENASRARLEQLERVVEIFPWVAIVDAFQHWLYTHPGHSPEERADKWVEIFDRFSAPVDWSGTAPEIKKFLWHRQLHIFEVPFYYIEYAIAQLGALQFYRLYRDDPQQAVDNYLNALSLGGSRGPVDLFSAGGIKFDFSRGMLKTLMDMVEEEMENL